MSTYNGEKYLPAQIDSIMNQSFVDVTLYIRDDNSSDNTVSVIKDYCNRSDRIVYAEDISGVHNDIGIGSSFFHLLRYVKKSCAEYDYYAFSDQDDVWNEDKLSRAVTALSGKRKALYFSKKTIVNNDMEIIGKDPAKMLGDFTDYLSPNDAFGCTIVIDKIFADMLLEKEIESYPFIHDITMFKTAVCTDTEIVFDQSETIRYRQHALNVTGNRSTALFSAENVKRLVSGRRHYLSLLSKYILRDYGEYVNSESKENLKAVIDYRKWHNGVELLKMYFKSERSPREKVRFMLMIILRGI